MVECSMTTEARPNTQVNYSNVIESTVTNGVGFKLNVPEKGSENQISLEIKLGGLKNATNGLTKDEYSDMVDLIAWKKDLSNLGVEGNVVFDGFDDMLSSFMYYQMLNRSTIFDPRNTRLSWSYDGLE